MSVTAKLGVLGSLVKTSAGLALTKPAPRVSSSHAPVGSHQLAPEQSTSKFSE